MNMIEAVQSCFRQYFGFGGRARRSEFWYWTLFTILAGIVLGVIDGMLFGWEDEDAGPISGLFSLATLIPGLAVGWRRLHDTGRSGWWIGGFYLALLVFGILAGVMALSGMDGGTTSNEGMLASLGFLVIIGVLAALGYVIMLIVFFCQPSKAGDNRYGPNPIDGGMADVFA
jgi:uncharacterized membrane protein YhaH (DUF805 family)